VITPQPPDFAVPWDDLDREHPWIAAMRGVPQDAIHHAEGDVWIHTRMVCEALVGMPAWRELDASLRERLFVAALLHDVAKPTNTVIEDGRVRAPGHSPTGSMMAREILWRLGWPASRREPICGLVRFHQVPYHAIDRSDARRVIIRLSQSVSARELAILCEADVRGRVCADQQRQLDNIELFRELCRELGCFDAAYAFASNHARAMYFHLPDRDPDWDAYDDTRLEVTLMSGLPAAGKSRWVAEHASTLPVIELDAIRSAEGIDPDEAQGRVVALARERAREHLRAAEPFVWDATNLSRQLRQSLITLCYDYKARVRIVHVEAPPDVLRTRNRARANPVPDTVIDRLLRRWEIPQRTEAHDVAWIE
jgi:predicted kinase